MSDLSPILPQIAPIADVAPASGAFDGQEPPKSAVTNIEFGYDLMSQIRDVASSPSTLTEFLQDPAVINTLTGNNKTRKKSKTRGASSSPRREPHGSSSATMMGLVLAEEERQVNHLKAVLKTTGDRLEQEIKRADRAEQRAERAEARAMEMASRVTTAEAGQHTAELHSVRLKEDIIRLQMQVENMNGILRRAQEDVDRIEGKRAEAEESAEKSRGVAKKFQMALNDYHAGEEARDEARRTEIQRWYDIGRQEGWDAGREDGFNEGEQEGYQDGKRSGFEEGRRASRDRAWDQGREQGRKEERQNALKAFEKFLKDEMHGRRYRDDHSDSIQRWTESEYFDDPSEDGSSYFSRRSR